MTMQASEAVVAAAGGAFSGSLSLYGTGGNCLVCTVQVDHAVFAVGQDDFHVAQYALEEWLGEGDQDAEPTLLTCGSAEEAWETLQFIRRDCLLWQCGGCDGWIFTAGRPRIGTLRCSTCGDGGVDFRHADRHVG